MKRLIVSISLLLALAPNIKSELGDTSVPYVSDAVGYFVNEVDEALPPAEIEIRLREVLKSFGSKQELYSFFEARNGARLVRPLIHEMLDGNFIVDFYYPCEKVIMNVRIIIEFEGQHFLDVHYSVGFTNQPMADLIMEASAGAVETAWGYKAVAVPGID